MTDALIVSKTAKVLGKEAEAKDFAYRLVSNKDFPSWGYWIENGAIVIPANSSAELYFKEALEGYPIVLKEGKHEFLLN